MTRLYRQNSKDGRAYVRVPRNTALIIAGEIGLDEWDDEELPRGHKRDRNGRFSGRPPEVVPRHVYQEFCRRQLERVEQAFVTNVAAAVEELVKIAQDPDVDDGTRLKAIQMVMDRTLGAVKQRVDIGGMTDGREPWQAVLDSVTIDRSLPEDDEVVDAEIVDEEPDWDDSLEAWDD